VTLGGMLSPYKIGNHLMTDIYLFRHMFSLTSLGEGSEKRPTLTNHTIDTCVRSSKQSSGAFLARIGEMA
jgi:hypothetical protein